MPDEISISKTLSIQECGLNEHWLQGQIAARPSILGLGDLLLVEREKRQARGGRLDILLKNAETDALFEVEVMLGATDGDHINRAIEYWLNEKRQSPQRDHFPVLIAEEITDRFFDVIHFHSQAIPIIAIKVAIVVVDGKKALHFTKILNASENSESCRSRLPETTTKSGPRELGSESEWSQKSPLMVECAKKTFAAISSALPQAKLKFCKFGVIITVGSRTYFWFKQERGDKAVLNFWVDKARAAEAQSLLRKCSCSPSEDDGYVRAPVTPKALIAHASLFEQLGPMVDTARRTSNHSFT